MARALTILLTLMLAGCGLPYPATPVSAEASCTATLAIVPPHYTIQSTARRWLATDIYEYDVSLQAWNGTSYADLSPPVTVALPPSGTTRAVFTHLRRGVRYQARLVIRGNPGGTAPDSVLNAHSTRTPPVFDFSASQDVEDTVSATFQDDLDAVDFSGTATISPAAFPAAATDWAATLTDAVSGAVLASTTGTAAQRAVFSHLKAGVSYQVALEARQDGVPIATASSAPFSWDPAATSLEQDQTVAVSF